MSEAKLIRLSTPETIKSIVMAIVNESKTAPLLLGPPGVGKSEATKQAFQALTYAIASGAGLSIPDEVMLAKAKETLEETAKEFSVRVNKERTYEDILFNDALNATARLLENGDLVEYLREFVAYAKGMCTGWKECEFAKRYASAVSSSSVVARITEDLPKALTKAFLAYKAFGTYDLIVEYDDKYPVELYKDALVYVSFNISSMSTSSVTGLPYVSERGATNWPPKWAVALRSSLYGVLNLDEVTNKMSELLQSAVYNIVLNKQVGSFKFGKFVVGTGNTKSTSKLVGNLPGPLFTGRFSQIEVTPPTVSEWAKYMDRVYGNSWYKPVKTLLDLTSRYGSLYKQAVESGSSGAEKIADRVFSKSGLVGALVGDFGDSFLPVDPSKYSKIEPGMTSSFPSPRAWTQVSLVLDKLAKVALSGGEAAERAREEVVNVVIATTGVVGLAHVLSAAVGWDIKRETEEIRNSNGEQLAKGLVKEINGVMSNLRAYDMIAKLIIKLSAIESSNDEGLINDMEDTISRMINEGEEGIGVIVLYYMIQAMKK